MPCFHPIPAWRSPSGEVLLRETPDARALWLACSTCLGCRWAHARGWALRCHHEYQLHDAALFTTLTYDDDHVPPTLEQRHLQLWLKRFRKALGLLRTPILLPRNTVWMQRSYTRFFASGEYGDTYNRPHYHALLFGPRALGTYGEALATASWTDRDGKPIGLVRTYPASAAAINYVAGYTDKKIGFKERARPDQVDPRTGEVYTWKPPFIAMSRRPGIGAHARQWVNSWRDKAVLNGHEMPVPRYYHEAWKATATPEEQEQLQYEKDKAAILRDTTQYRLEAEERLAIARQKLKSQRRRH